MKSLPAGPPPCGKAAHWALGDRPSASAAAAAASACCLAGRESARKAARASEKSAEAETRAATSGDAGKRPRPWREEDRAEAQKK